MKKIKLLTTLSTLGVVATVTPAVATSCSLQQDFDKIYYQGQQIYPKVESDYVLTTAVGATPTVFYASDFTADKGTSAGIAIDRVSAKSKNTNVISINNSKDGKTFVLTPTGEGETDVEVTVIDVTSRQGTATAKFKVEEGTIVPSVTYTKEAIFTYETGFETQYRTLMIDGLQSVDTEAKYATGSVYNPTLCNLLNSKFTSTADGTFIEKLAMGWIGYSLMYYHNWTFPQWQNSVIGGYNLGDHDWIKLRWGYSIVLGDNAIKGGSAIGFELVDDDGLVIVKAEIKTSKDIQAKMITRSCDKLPSSNDLEDYIVGDWAFLAAKDDTDKSIPFTLQFYTPMTSTPSVFDQQYYVYASTEPIVPLAIKDSKATEATSYKSENFPKMWQEFGAPNPEDPFSVVVSIPQNMLETKNTYTIKTQSTLGYYSAKASNGDYKFTDVDMYAFPAGLYMANSDSSPTVSSMITFGKDESGYITLTPQNNLTWQQIITNLDGSPYAPVLLYVPKYVSNLAYSTITLVTLSQGPAMCVGTPCYLYIEAQS